MKIIIKLTEMIRKKDKEGGTCKALQNWDR